MKLKFLSVLLALTAMMVMPSCNEKEIDDKEEVVVIFPKDQNPRFANEYELLTQALIANNYFVYGAILDMGSAEKQAESIKKMLNTDAKTLVFLSIDPNSLVISAALEKVHAAGRKVICYDRLQQNTEAVDVVISTDSKDIGKLQGKIIADLPQSSTIELIAGPSIDPNSRMLYDGAVEVLKEKIDLGIFTIPSGRKEFNDIKLSEWTADAGYTYMKEILASYYPNGTYPDGVLAPNDLVAQGVVKALSEITPAIEKYPYLTGQDNTTESRILIKSGRQTVTFDKDPAKLVLYSVQAVNAFGMGIDPTPNVVLNNGVKNVPYIKVDPILINKNNIY